MSKSVSEIVTAERKRSRSDFSSTFFMTVFYYRMTYGTM